MGLPVYPIYAAAKSDYPNRIIRTANKRAECWCAMAEWLKAGAIPNDPQLKAELVGPECSENAQGLILERKSDMAARGLASPDTADSLSLTFAVPIFTQAMSELTGRGDHLVQSSYDPWSDEAMQGKPIPELRKKYIAPGYPLKEEYGGDVDVFRDPQGLWGPEPE
jgi:hypothetical protein